MNVSVNIQCAIFLSLHICNVVLSFVSSDDPDHGPVVGDFTQCKLSFLDMRQNLKT